LPITVAGRTGPSPEILRSISAAAQRTGVPFGYLLNQARIESSFDPDAKASTSSAEGLYQFTRQTWLATLDAHGAEHGLGWAAGAIDGGPSGYSIANPEARQAILDLRNDPAAAAAMAAALAADNGRHLSKVLGRPATATDLSLAHFLGADGAAKFLTALEATPEASAAPLFPDAAAANQGVFFTPGGAPRSLAEIHARIDARIGASPGPAGAPLAAPVLVREAYRSHAQSSSWTGGVRTIEPMPGRLSLAFAQSAYRRLSSLGDDA
jgi:hypothetical protein